MLVYKQIPVLPLQGSLRVWTEAELVELGNEQVESLLSNWLDIFAAVRDRQAIYDRCMIKTYLHRKGLDCIDVRFMFAPG